LGGFCISSRKAYSWTSTVGYLRRDKIMVRP
jgi:hypothetical protein